MTWLQLELETHQDQAEELSELFEQFGAISVSLSATSDEPVFDTQDDNDSHNQQLWKRTRITALLHPDSDLDIILVCVRDRIGAENIYNHKIELIKNRDWVSEYQSEHQAIIYSDRLCVSPSWCESPTNNIPTVILDPGLAFGTGSHPTTSLCIEWMLDNDLTDSTVIDYGCGSGILAMVAAKLGAKQVYAVDIDPQAIVAAKDNIKNNKLNKKIIVNHVHDADLPVADVLLANILMNPLKELSGKFPALVTNGGHIVLSGLLHIQAEECLDAYADSFIMDEPVFNSEWARLHGIKK